MIPSSTHPGNESLRDAYARLNGCAPEAFERRMFVRCVSPGYRPLAFMLIRLVPDWFSLDLEVLEDIGRSTRLDEVRELCGDFKVGVRHRPSFIRDTLGLRTSGRRVFAIAQQILGPRPSS